MSDSKMIRLGGLWLRKSKDGRQFMAGGFGPFTDLLIFKNEKKENEKAPDYYVCVAEKRDEQKQEKKKDSSDDIPF